MKLAHPMWSAPICWEEGFVQTLVLEDPKSFRAMTLELLAQTDGAEGDYVLSRKGKILSFSKSVEIIFDLFALEVNEKKILGKIYKALAAYAAEDRYPETLALRSVISGYMHDLFSLSDRALTFDADFSVESLMKFLDVKIETESEDLLGKLLDHMSVVCEFLGIDTFFFYHLKSYFSEEELTSFAKEVAIRKYHVLLLENVMREQCFPWEKIKWIDKDLCEIMA